MKPLDQFEAECIVDNGPMPDEHGEIAAIAGAAGLHCYRGFTENARRLLYNFEDLLSFPQRPHLKTFLPSGVKETDKKLKSEVGKGLIAFVYPQSCPTSLLDTFQKYNVLPIDGYSGEVLQRMMERKPFSTFHHSEDGGGGVMEIEYRNGCILMCSASVCAFIRSWIIISGPLC